MRGQTSTPCAKCKDRRARRAQQRCFLHNSKILLEPQNRTKIICARHETEADSPAGTKLRAFPKNTKKNCAGHETEPDSPAGAKLRAFPKNTKINCARHETEADSPAGAKLRAFPKNKDKMRRAESPYRRQNPSGRRAKRQCAPRENLKPEQKRCAAFYRSSEGSRKNSYDRSPSIH